MSPAINFENENIKLKMINSKQLLTNNQSRIGNKTIII